MAKRAGRIGFGSGQSGRGSKRVIFKRVKRVGSNRSDPFCHVYPYAVLYVHVRLALSSYSSLIFFVFFFPFFALHVSGLFFLIFILYSFLFPFYFIPSKFLQVGLAINIAPTLNVKPLLPIRQK